MFQAAPEPVAMRINAQPPVASSSSDPHRALTPPTIGPSAFWFQDAPPLRQLGSSSRIRDGDDRMNDARPRPSSRTSSGRPLSLSPTRPPIPVQHQLNQEGGTSDSPFVIPDSPELREGKLAFVPFVREQMRIPTFTKAPVIPSKGLHWHDSDKSRKRKEKEWEAMESRPKARRRSSIAKVHFDDDEDEVEEEVEMVESVNANRKQGQKRRAGDSDDDEWADFRF